MKINDEGTSNAAHWHERAMKAEARLADEQERHAQLQARCFDQGSQSVFDAVQEARAETAALREERALIIQRAENAEATLARLEEVYATTVDCWKADGERLAEADALLTEIAGHRPAVAFFAPQLAGVIGTLNRIDAHLAGAAVQPNGATGWIDNAVTPPGESVERVLVAYPTGLVETTQAHYVRLYPTNYPWWMPLPVAPDPTPQPQPDAVASTFADCETAMGMEYTTPPCACAEYYPGLPHHPDCPTRNADPTPAAQPSAAHAFCGPFPEQSEDERTLRFLLALRCGEPGELYGDDGELQLGGFPHPIDFRRDSVQEIRRKLAARGMAKLAEQMRNADPTDGAP